MPTTTVRPYEVMVIIDADLDEETIRAAVERWLQLIESKGANAAMSTSGASAVSPTR